MCGLTPKGSARRSMDREVPSRPGCRRRAHVPGGARHRGQRVPAARAGKALALFFGIAGGLTAIGPILGGYLTEWTWRAIFWVNIPVALIALVLIAVSKPKTQYRRAPIDYLGAVLIAAGIGLSIFGLQQSVPWGWSNPGTWVCIIGGLVIIAIFVVVETADGVAAHQGEHLPYPAFSVENVVLLIAMMAFIPVFFFASEYAQIALNDSASEAGIFLLYFFIGFVVRRRSGDECSTGRGPSGPS